MTSQAKILYVRALCPVALAVMVLAPIGVAGVLGGCRTTEPARLLSDDATITGKIKAKLAADADLGASNIAVTSADGVVTLEGHVKKEGARETLRRLERYARETDGVQRVIDLVKVGDTR